MGPGRFPRASDPHGKGSTAMRSRIDLFHGDRPGGSIPAALLLFLAGLALVCAVPGLTAAHVPTTSASPSAGVETIKVMATGALSFQPDQLTVSPGDPVELIVTQAAAFEHTFTLSSVANFTIPSGDSSAQLAAFFNAHPPIVNLSLGSRPGAEFFANFTAPADRNVRVRLSHPLRERNDQFPGLRLERRVPRAHFRLRRS